MRRKSVVDKKVSAAGSCDKVLLSDSFSTFSKFLSHHLFLSNQNKNYLNWEGVSIIQFSWNYKKEIHDFKF